VDCEELGASCATEFASRAMIFAPSDESADCVSFEFASLSGEFLGSGVDIKISEFHEDGF